MDYEKKYKNALEWARQVINGETGFIRKEVEEVFPELKESEDERIRKAIIDFFSEPGRKEYILNGFTVDDILAWLKYLKDRIQPQPKQEWSEEDEQNLANSAKTCKDEQTPAWSEEDKKYLRRAINATRNGYPETNNWLKSLKERYTWKPSDEQMDALQYVFRNINPPLSDKLGWGSIKTLELLYHDLKKLKEE